jgi:hypothetical protein
MNLFSHTFNNTYAQFCNIDVLEIPQEVYKYNWALYLLDVVFSNYYNLETNDVQPF